MDARQERCCARPTSDVPEGARWVTALNRMVQECSLGEHRSES